MDLVAKELRFSVPLVKRAHRQYGEYAFQSHTSKPDAAMVEWGRSPAEAVGLLRKVPPDQVIYPIMQWTVR